MTSKPAPGPLAIRDAYPLDKRRPPFAGHGPGTRGGRGERELRKRIGTTALSVALIQDQFAVALFLLQHGADPRKPVLQRPTPAGRRPVYLPEYLAEVRKPGQNDAEIAQILAFLRTRKGVIVH